MEQTNLESYTLLLEAQLGAILAHTVHSSKESSKVIRDLSKNIDSISVALRKELVDFDKSLIIKEP